MLKHTKPCRYTHRQGGFIHFIFLVFLVIFGIILVVTTFDIGGAATSQYSAKDYQEMQSHALQQAAHYKDQAQALNHQAENNIDDNQQQVKAMQQTAQEAREKLDDYVKMMQDKIIQGKAKNEEARQAYLQKTYHGLIIFVSLGMPNASLKALLHQAAQVNAPVIIQGLYKNNLKATASKIQSLITPRSKDGQLQPFKAQGGIMIDPTWFKMYDIKEVPAFVITNQFVPCTDSHTCKPQDYDVLTGNLSVLDALTVFKKKGQAKFHDIVDRYKTIKQ